MTFHLPTAEVIIDRLSEQEDTRTAANIVRTMAMKGKRQPTPTFRRNPGLIMLRGVVGEAVDDGRDRELL